MSKLAQEGSLLLPLVEDIENLPTLCVGQCCSLKVEDANERVWLCRVNGGVSIERFDGKRWRVVAGSCSTDPKKYNAHIDELARWHRANN